MPGRDVARDLTRCAGADVLHLTRRSRIVDSVDALISSTPGRGLLITAADCLHIMLLDPRTLSRPYVQRQTVENMVRHHLNGDRNYTTEIHRLLTLELQHRLFVDRN